MTARRRNEILTDCVEPLPNGIIQNGHDKTNEMNKSTSIDLKTFMEEGKEGGEEEEQQHYPLLNNNNNNNHHNNYHRTKAVSKNIFLKYKWIIFLSMTLMVILITSTVATSKEYTGARRQMKLLFLMEKTVDINTIHPIQENHQHQQQQEEQEEDPIPYQILDAESIHNQLFEMAKSYPKFVTLTNAQKEFNLQAAGTKSDCPFDPKHKGCRNWILTIEDKLAHPQHSLSWKLLPEVFLSGALHGDERIGPTVVMEVAKLLLQAVSCESQQSYNNIQTSPMMESEEGEEEGENCRNELFHRVGMTDMHRQWLSRLVSTRRIILLPTANALGYYHKTRNEGGKKHQDLDPNRDFPFDLDEYPTSPNCMRTIAARTINEIFRNHMFQIGLTFHSGMETIAYEWGSRTFFGLLSPDDIAQRSIAQGYSRQGGYFDKTRSYITGTMNDIVYFVQGGMEDWSYAGSSFPDMVPKCHPNTDNYKEYHPNRTIYNNSTHRMFNMLIETSKTKTPSNTTLGTSKSLFSPYLSISEQKHFNASHIDNGHIARNIRISLMAIDIVQPYVSILGVNHVSVLSDIVPSIKMNMQGSQAILSNLDDSSSSSTTTTTKTTVQWTVGGGFDIDETTLIYAPCHQVDYLWKTNKNDDHDHDAFFIPDTMLDGSNSTSPFHRIGHSFGGTTRWHKKGPSPSSSSSNKTTLGPIFSTIIDTSSFFLTHNNNICILAIAKLDSKWSDSPPSSSSSSSNKESSTNSKNPLSHLVNTRTNANWFHQSGGKVIRGKIWWHSNPLILVMDQTTKKNKNKKKNYGTTIMTMRTATTTTTEEETTTTTTIMDEKEEIRNSGWSMLTKWITKSNT